MLHFIFFSSYTPQNIELDYKLHPFIPDFIPAVGDIDAFLKISRPDGKSDSIGLTVLDEPCAKQSEPAVLHLQLRAVAKQSSAKAVVGTINLIGIHFNNHLLVSEVPRYKPLNYTCSIFLFYHE
jgi:hypothetical protein